MNRNALYRQVGELHARNLDQGFLSTMGVDFLALMYQAIDETSGSVLLVERHGDEVVGFVSGGIGMTAIYRRMLAHPLRLAVAMAPCILHPRRLVKVLEILRYSGRGALHDHLPAAELLSIAVAPAWRGSQVAERLYRRLIKHFENRDVTVFKIIVGERLIPAQRFYQRMGAVLATEIEVHNGEPSQIYLHQLGAFDAQASKKSDQSIF